MKQFALAHPAEQQLGPLTKALRGRKLYDLVLVRDGMRVICADGVRVDIQWSSRGAVLAGLRTRNLPSPDEPLMLQSRFHFMRAKTIDCVRSEDGVMGLVMTDGHILRCDWRAQQPTPVAVDVNVPIECPPGVGMSGVIIH